MLINYLSYLKFYEDNDDVQVVSSNFAVDDAVMSHLTS